MVNALALTTCRTRATTRVHVVCQQKRKDISFSFIPFVDHSLFLHFGMLLGWLPKFLIRRSVTLGMFHREISEEILPPKPLVLKGKGGYGEGKIWRRAGEVSDVAM